MANQSSDSLVLFRIDPQTGRLVATGQSFEVGDTFLREISSVELTDQGEK